jgi:hypothetical protein
MIMGYRLMLIIPGVILTFVVFDVAIEAASSRFP